MRRSEKGKKEKPSERSKTFRTVDLTKSKPKPKPVDKHQMDLFSSISVPEPETPPTEEGILTSFHLGQHVLHNKFGEGDIVHIAGSGETAKFTVKFGRDK